MRRQRVKFRSSGRAAPDAAPGDPKLLAPVLGLGPGHDGGDQPRTSIRRFSIGARDGIYNKAFRSLRASAISRRVHIVVTRKSLADATESLARLEPTVFWTRFCLRDVPAFIAGWLFGFLVRQQVEYLCNYPRSHRGWLPTFDDVDFFSMVRTSPQLGELEATSQDGRLRNLASLGLYLHEQCSVRTRLGRYINCGRLSVRVGSASLGVGR